MGMVWYRCMAAELTFEFDEEAHQGALVVCLTGELNRENFSRLYPEIQQRVAARQHLIFDFHNLHYMDSGGLGILVRIWKEITIPREGRLLIVGANSMTRQLLRFTQLQRNMPNFATLDLALAQLPADCH